MNLRDYIDPVMKKATGQMEDEIRAAVEFFMGDNFTLDQVRDRCKLIKIHGQPGETLHIDGTPALHIYEPEFSYEFKEQSLVCRVERKYRRLWKPAVVQTPPSGEGK